MHREVWDQIAYPSGGTIDIWEWISSLTSHSINYLSSVAVQNRLTVATDV